MKLYELVLIVKNDIFFKDIKKLQNIYYNIIINLGCIIIKKEYWGLRLLSYIIKNNKKAHYIFFIVKIDPCILNKLKNSLKIKENILKYFILRISKTSYTKLNFLQDFKLNNEH